MNIKFLNIIYLSVYYIHFACMLSFNRTMYDCESLFQTIVSSIKHTNKHQMFKNSYVVNTIINFDKSNNKVLISTIVDTAV